MRRRLLSALVAAGLLSLASLAGPPYVYCDQALQLTAVQAWHQNKTSFPNWLVDADPADLSRDRARWEIWHAPGFPVLLAALTSVGIGLGPAVHLLAIACFLIGCLGWTRWAERFRLPSPWREALPWLIPGIRYGNDNLIHFHAEAFVFAATPWVLSMSMRRLISPGPALLRGSILGAMGLLKFSALLPAVGVLAIAVNRQRRPHLLLPLMLMTILPVVLLSLLNRHLGAAGNLVMASWRLHFSWEAPLWLAGTIPLGWADAGQMFEAACDYFCLPQSLVPCLGLPGLMGLIILSREARPTPLERAVLVFVAINLVLQLAIWLVCDGVGFDRRYLAPAALALLPVVLAWLTRVWPTSSSPARLGWLTFAGFYLLVPVAYGYLTFGLKCAQAASYRPASSGLWDPLLTARDGAGVAARLEAFRTDPAHDLWYLPEPILALDLPDRRILGHAHWTDPLSGEQAFHTSHPVRILALAPIAVPDSDVRRALPILFPQAGKWQKQLVPGAAYSLWIARLFP